MTDPAQTQTVTIAVKALNGPLMLCLLAMQLFSIIALWNIVGAIRKISKTYDDQIYGDEQPSKPTDLAE